LTGKEAGGKSLSVEGKRGVLVQTPLSVLERRGGKVVLDQDDSLTIGGKGTHFSYFLAEGGEEEGGNGGLAEG